MTGTKNELLASMERELAVDPKAAADVLMLRAREFATYHAAILRIARPLLRELIVLNAAQLETVAEDTTLDVGTLLGAVAMALDDPRLTVTMAARIARARSTISTEAVRQMAATTTEPTEVPPPGRPN